MGHFCLEEYFQFFRILLSSEDSYLQVQAIIIAILISIGSSFTVGAIKARMAHMNIIIGGIEMAGLGTGIALIGYGIGAELVRVGIVNM